MKKFAVEYPFEIRPLSKDGGSGYSIVFHAVSERFVQRVPRSLHAQLVAQAEAEGVSLNTLVVSLVSQGLGRRQPGARRLTAGSTASTRKRPAR